MTDEQHPPGPMPTPRCRACDYHPMHGHHPDCEVGRLQAIRWSRVHIIETALSEAVRERREDDAFMERLEARIRTDRAILDKLAEA